MSIDTNLEVILDDLEDNPRCEHGPALLFRRKCTKSKEIVEEFYSCSACRDRKSCSFYLKKSDRNIWKNRARDVPINHDEYTTKYQEILKLNPKQRGYCASCLNLVKNVDFKRHANHELITDISDDQLCHPTQLLNPLSQNKKEAQYFFSKSTLDFFAHMLHNLNLSKVICIGTPRLHEFLTNSPKYSVQSILLDFDRRFHIFYGANEFCWYNMFNNHFFGGISAQNMVRKFLKLEINEKVCIVCDPPFGCRTEPLAHTLKILNTTYQSINSTKSILPIFWVFPYYMETYITNVLPELEMLDYKVNYTNHETYHDGKNGRKQGSPVRIFTNVGIDNITLPSNEEYKFCKDCNKWVARENRHCKFCNICPSKNGDTYVHCRKCRMCVKPNYVHCNKCTRCTQSVGHNCDEYQKNVACWICRRKGHVEENCVDWFKLSKQGKNTGIGSKTRRCRICKGKGHCEKYCSKRANLLSEYYFLGKYYNILNS